ncbi:SdrD B-like domain-containing protein [Cohnella faecalis]|uniref:LPXTG cell wall anchor domain-containing protein n=1 Tax=Cohnella faecalis TaxID=2315694 RepID=A0A398CTF0_9BACL|nr:SdrD B-like domain-containing protein [Cohnella faecalis]RIE04539.1 LPXTG cell wall anchor domain-containing protein [Cohnella faecalis]
MKLLKSLGIVILSVALLWNFSWLPKPVANADGTNGVILEPFTVSKTTVKAGEVFTYRIAFSFSALLDGADFTKLKVELTLPDGVEFDDYLASSVVAGYTKTGRTYSFNFKTGADAPRSGSSYTIELNAHFPNHDTPNNTTTTPTHFAVVQYDGAPVTLETSNDVTVTSEAIAKWALTKKHVSPEPTPMIGDKVQYEIFFNNEQSSDTRGVVDIENVVLTDVLPAEAVFISASAGGVHSGEPTGGTVTWSPGKLSDDQRYYVTVAYPLGSVVDPDHDEVTNLAAAVFNPLGTDPIADKVSLAAVYKHGFTTLPQDLGPGGMMNKWVHEREREISPDQDVHFYIGGLRNRSNGELTGASIVDMTPPDLILKSIDTAKFEYEGHSYEVYYESASDPGNWQLWDGNVSSDTSKLLEVSDLPGGTVVSGVKFVFPDPLLISFRQSSNFQLTYKLRPDFPDAMSGQVRTNTATLEYTFDGTTVSHPYTANVRLWGIRPLVRIDKSVVSDGPYQPMKDKNIVEYEIAVSNSDYTTMPFYDPIVVDVLPKELEYVDTSWTVSSNTGFSGNDKLIMDPPVVQGDGTTKLLWKFSSLATLNKNDKFVIRFKAKLKDYTAPTADNHELENVAYLTTNNALNPYINDYYFDPLIADADDLDGDGQFNDKMIDSKAYVKVNKVAQLDSVKQVRGELDNDWQVGDLAHLANTTEGGRVDYKLTVRNGSNIPVKNISVVDVLPRVGDQGVLVSDARQSTWSTVLTAPIPDVAGVYTVYYNTGASVKMTTPGGWTATPPADLTTVTAIKFLFDAAYQLSPGASYDIIWTMIAPVGTDQDEIAWNSFAHQATEIDGSSIAAAEPPKVGVHVQNIPANKGSLGNYVWVDLDKDGTQNEGAEWGLNGVRAELYEADGVTPVQKFGINVFTVTGDDIDGNPGYYMFPNLDFPHSYKVKLIVPTSLPSGYTANTFTGWTDKSKAGSTPINDSDVVPASGLTDVIALNSHTPDLKWDAGLLPPLGSIGDYVWHDVNGNGLQSDDAADKGINGVQVKLEKEIAGSWVYQTTQTTADKGGNPGYYEFAGLLPGKYRVLFPDKLADGKILTKKQQGGNAAIDSNPYNNTSSSHGYTDAITLRLGEIVDTIDAGYAAPASIGNYAWSDLNDNGLQDAGEPGIASVKASLLDSSNNPIKRNGINYELSTDASGSYLFEDLLPGTYKVKFDLPTGGYAYARQDAAGGTDAVDSDASRTNGRTGSYTLAAGDSNLTVDAGYVKLVKLGDYVWMDKNRNGQQDAGESGVPNVTVNLYNDEVSTTTAAATTATDANGNYEFANLVPGKYSVEFVRPNGYLFTSKGTVPAATNDSNANVPAAASTAKAKTDQITLLPAIDNLSIDAGLIELASVGDFVWHDSNDNGLRDVGETGIAGATVQLLDSDGDPVAADAYGQAISILSTGADGKYLFDHLLPGDYQVKFTLPTGYWFAKLNEGADDSIDSDAVKQPSGDPGDPAEGVAAVTLAAGDHNMTVDAGALSLARLGDFVWHDKDGNGIQNAGESGVASVKVELLKADGTPVTIDAYGNGISPVLTAANGSYAFINLLPGDYKVKFSELPAGYVFTTSGQGTSATDSDANPAAGANLGVTSPVHLDWGETNNTIDAGIVNRAALGDFVWYDSDGDGVQDAGEPGIVNVNISLYKSSDLTTALASTLTGADGKYSFTNLWPGDYIVKFSLPSDYYIFSPRLSGGNVALDSDANPASGNSGVVTLQSGDNDIGVDAGIVELVSIGDLLWDDTDDDGVQDAGEIGYGGVKVHLLNGTGTPILNGGAAVTATTDANGNYLFDKLNPGSYQVRFELPAGYMFAKKNSAGGTAATDSDVNPATGTTDTLVLAPGAHRIDVDAGIVKLASLGDHVWMDRNLNGIQDGGESGVGGVTIRLLDAAGNPVQSGGADVTTTTNGDGDYTFANLVPAAYKVKFNLPAGYVFTQKGAGTSATDSDADPTTGANQGVSSAVTLAPGDNDANTDAGLIKLVNLGDVLWVDTGIIGAQEGEATNAAASGVLVSLYDGSGSPVLSGGIPVTTTTAADGSYLFTGLFPGAYKVKFDLPSGYLFTRKHVTGAGITTASDSDVDASGWTDAVTLTAGDDNLTVDAGIVLPAALGDYVWNDSNQNGIQDAGESGRNGVKVELYDANGALLQTATTADNAGAPGYYSFANLLPGTYKVKFKAPSGYMFTVKRAGANQAIDSDAGYTGESDPVTLSPGENNLNIDAGVHLVPPIPPATLGNYVWIDSNADGIQDSGEKGLNGVTIELYNRFGALVLTKTTANDKDGRPGYYLFESIQADDYSVKFILPSGYVFSPSKKGADGETDSDAGENGATGTITLQPGQVNLSVDAGLTPLSSIGNFVWIDADNNGKQDVGEKGQNGISVSLLDESGARIASVLTDNDSNGQPGYYEFKNLLPGNYRIEFELPIGYVFSKLNAAGTNSDNDSNAGENGLTGLVTLAPGARDLTIDAGLVFEKVEPVEPPVKEVDGNNGTGGGKPAGSGGSKGGNSGSKGNANGAATGGQSEGKANVAGDSDSNEGRSNVKGVGDGKSLPQTGEEAPIYPYFGYGLILSALALLIARKKIKA